MKSSQINFYFTPNDIKDIIQYIESNGLLIIEDPMPTPDLKIVHSLDLNPEKTSIKYILNPKDQEFVIRNYIQKQNYYVISPLESPLIELWQPILKNNFHGMLYQGRVYYVKDYLDKATKTEHLKNSDFLHTADSFFKWIRKNFKNAKLPNYEGFLVSENAAKWAKETGGELVLN